jgi:hypothetical protein
MSSIFNRIRSKSISCVNQLSGLHQTIPQGPPGYCYIENFDFTTEEECIKIDNENLNLYRKNKQLYDDMTKKIEIKNALFKLEKAPNPPLEPNNYEKLIKYKQRNIIRNVKLQTFAVQKLLEKGYKLYFDYIDNKTELDFEPFQAIELLEKIEDDIIENIYKNEINKLTNSPQIQKKSLSFQPSTDSSQPTTEKRWGYVPYYNQPSDSNYPPVYLSPTNFPPNFSPPTLYRNVAPPASHYISNA